jgi:hypothetical protein
VKTAADEKLERDEVKLTLIKFLGSRRGTLIQQDYIAPECGFRDTKLVDEVLMEMFREGWIKSEHMTVYQKIEWGVKLSEKGLNFCNEISRP